MNNTPTWFEVIIEYLKSLPAWSKLAVCLFGLGIILWGTIRDYDWAIRWTNTAKFQVWLEVLGRDGIRVLNGVLIIIAMLALTYLFLR